ncbi:hypothetical protein HYPSUDRAFT_41277 [Hypholoma sublateritium FD-334 SS-4]|uniref:Uncharacterized protein n=1 Tax=Hypholoma sublateritium (strain FD-334 SS-4) TaxID=945553 RepID=A0A0D2NTG6_HYPSF|nr:hypothetical protein HYPSUDRAFT_41277 [Hypholoma sublateritium FD-334 SS-4]
MSNPISNQAIPLSYDDQVIAAGDNQTAPDIASNVRKYNIDDQSQPPVAHHVHRENESLPGAAGSAPTFDYSPDTIAQAHIPNSELGYTPPSHPHAHQDSTHHATRSPGNFTTQERDNAPQVPQGSAPIAPYDRTVLDSALGNPTTKSQEFERNPLKKSDDDQSQTYQSHSSAPFIPPHIGSTEARAESYNIDGQPKKYNGTTNDTTSSDRNKASFGDKVIGTTEKIAGKVMRNSELQEKGQNRAHPA